MKMCRITSLVGVPHYVPIGTGTTHKMTHFRALSTGTARLIVNNKNAKHEVKKNKSEMRKMKKTGPYIRPYNTSIGVRGLTVPKNTLLAPGVKRLFIDTGKPSYKYPVSVCWGTKILKVLYVVRKKF